MAVGVEAHVLPGGPVPDVVRLVRVWLDPEEGAVAPSVERDALARAAWRIRMLERDREMRTIRAQGVPVVPWLGPGSLDVVLHQLARRGRSVGRLS